MPVIYLGTGSNLGNRMVNMQKALALLCDSPRLSGFELSPIYETTPVGYLNQGNFLNGVARAYTDLPPRTVLQMCQDIERQMCRVRTVRFGPRNIDVDLLFYESRVINEADLVVPHPRMYVRKFVLKPMCDLAPDFVHPVLQKSMIELLADLNDDKQIIKEYQC